jgi:hypothetical protein
METKGATGEKVTTIGWGSSSSSAEERWHAQLRNLKHVEGWMDDGCVCGCVGVGVGVDCG